MAPELPLLFNLQAFCFSHLKAFQNEFETMRFLFDLLPDNLVEHMRNLSSDWLEELDDYENMEYDLKESNEKESESKCLRQEGNRLFTAKGEKRNILGACRFYNDAIYANLDIQWDELALGFANRAMALQSFGYYQQAYDDCVIALKLRYPEAMRHKIVMRQAYCSIKMKKIMEAEKHINDLKLMKLRGSFLKELNDLSACLDELKNSADEDCEAYVKQDVNFNRHTQEIVTTNDGRCMKAKCRIEKNELIFTERATAFVAVGDTRRMCHQCGTLNFIPIPCLHCRGRVNYCSLICFEKHEEIHTIECKAYRMQLFNHVGIAHLALRTLLDDGIFKILDDLKLDENITTSDVWLKLSKGGDIWKNESIHYAATLRMISHLNKMPKKEIEWFALVSHLLLVYLKVYTKYFERLKTSNSTIDWELLTGSLILRHMGQLIANGHTLTGIIPHPINLLTTTDFHLLNENVWSGPWHLKLGYLHFFSNYDTMASMNLPYLSLCNHSCVQLFQTKFSGRFISTYALRDIEQAEEITNCYDLDYRKSKRQDRRRRLEQNYHFKCQCENCLQTESEDAEFNNFYKYRCDNNKCGKIFTCNNPEVKTFDLFHTDFPNSKIETNLECNNCGQKQKLKWYYEVKNLMCSIAATNSRRRLYDIFKETEKYLLDLNKARCFLAQQVLHECFILFWENHTFDEQDYSNIIEIIKYILNVTRARSSVNSTEYVIYMTYLWDLMAMQKYRCSKTEIDEMLFALCVISDDLKNIFINYFNDYIKDYLKL